MSNDEPDFSQFDQPTRNPSFREVGPRPDEQVGNFHWMDSPAPNMKVPERGGRDEEMERFRYTSTRRQAKSVSIKKWINHPKKKYIVIYLFQFLMAFLVALFTIVILYVINPPITQGSDGKQNYQSVLIFGFVMFLFVFVFPEFFRWIKY